ncbi:MAG: hypothetical protein ACYC27_16885 [Armatimonadota bacterium]
MKNAVDNNDNQIKQIVCKGCGARYDKLPAFTCPRCGSPLCASGCDGCKSSCGMKK